MSNPSDTGSAQPSTKPQEVSLQDRFFRYFQHEITALQDQMARLSDTAMIGGERADASDHCLAGIARLSNEVKDASSYLPTYDQRTYAEAIKALQEKLAETRAAFAPRPRFTFKTARKNPSAVSLNDAAELAAQKRRHIPGYLSPDSSSVDTSLSTTPNHLRTPPNEKSSDPDQQPVPTEPPPSSLGHDQFSYDASESGTTQAGSTLNPTSGPSMRPALSASSTTVAISNQSAAHLILPTASGHAATPCFLTKIEKCVVDMSVPTLNGAPFAGLTMKNVQSSLLLCGLVNGPAHITNVQNSVLMISCRQLRMHDCRNVDAYLTCSSRPIIEDCSGIRFARLPNTYEHMNEISGEGPPTQNMWDQVDDFKWLKAEQSPNWSILPTEDTVSDDVWREIVPGGPGWTLDDILKATMVLK